MNAIVPAEQAERTTRQSYQVIDPIPILDTARFEQMMRIAKVMASASLCPDALCMWKEEGKKDPIRLPYETVLANCFLVVNQAVRWNMDPFAVAQCVSVVHGKLCYEGKLIAAVIENKLGIRLQYEWDNKNGDALGIKVIGKYSDESNPRVVDGTVGAWKTTGNNSPWPKDPRKQLAYRGAREWGRLHAPAVMLGVYSEDEMDDLSSASHSSRARDVTSSREPPPPIVPEPPKPSAAEPPAPAIEHKPSIAMEPIPPRPEPVDVRQEPPAPREAKTVEVRDPDRIVETFVEAAEAAENSGDLFEAWQEIVEPAKHDMFPADFEECRKAREAALERLGR